MDDWIKGEDRPYMHGFAGVDEIATGGVEFHEYQRVGGRWARRTVCSNAGEVDTSLPEWVEDHQVPQGVRDQLEPVPDSRAK